MLTTRNLDSHSVAFFFPLFPLIRIRWSRTLWQTLRPYDNSPTVMMMNVCFNRLALIEQNDKIDTLFLIFPLPFLRLLSPYVCIVSRPITQPWCLSVHVENATDRSRCTISFTLFQGIICFLLFAPLFLYFPSSSLTQMITARETWKFSHKTDLNLGLASFVVCANLVAKHLCLDPTMIVFVVPISIWVWLDEANPSQSHSLWHINAPVIAKSDMEGSRLGSHRAKQIFQQTHALNKKMRKWLLSAIPFYVLCVTLRCTFPFVK